MMIDPHTYAENFLPEDEVKRNARAVGEEMGALQNEYEITYDQQ